MKQAILPTMLLVATLFTFSFGALTMHMDEHSSCPFMGDAAICPMNATEHLSFIQSIFIGITKDLSLIYLFLFIALIGSILITYNGPPIFSGIKFFYTKPHNLTILNKFLLALSGGIIQPKLYG